MNIFPKLLITVLCLINIQAMAQSRVECDTECTPEQMLEMRKYVHIQSKKTRSDSMVPIKFHIISYDNGFGAIDSSTVFNELALVNLHFQSTGLVFEHCGNIKYLQNTNYADFLKYTDESLCDTADAPNVLNVYFVPEVYRVSSSNDTTYICGYAVMGNATKNRVIVDNGCASNGSTLTHEIGHYFSLAHTHSTSSGVELVNGSNCLTAGDELCDTPADPTLSSATVSSSCLYTGSATDPNNDPYEPDPENIMSYSRKACRTIFSPEQSTRMANYRSSFRSYMSCVSFPVNTKDLEAVADIRIYPNPTRDILHIEGKDLLERIFIYDHSGRLLLDIQPSQVKQKVDFSTFSSGIYFYRILENGQLKSGKFFKD